MTPKLLISYHGKTELKEYFVNNAILHRKADAYVQGKANYSGEKGCMMACSFKAYDHGLAPTEAGVPVWLAKLVDGIFEVLTKEDSDLWTERFWTAIPVGVDLEKAKAPFLIFVLETTFSTFDCEKYHEVKSAVSNVIELLKRDDTTNEEFETARTAADAASTAAYTAADAARVAAYDAADACAATYAAAYSAAAAARAAAYADADADDASDAYAAADAYAADAARAADAVARAAAYADAIRSDVYKKFSDKLVEILQAMGETK